MYADAKSWYEVKESENESVNLWTLHVHATFAIDCYGKSNVKCKIYRWQTNETNKNAH